MIKMLSKEARATTEFTAAEYHYRLVLIQTMAAITQVLTTSMATKVMT